MEKLEVAASTSVKMTPAEVTKMLSEASCIQQWILPIKNVCTDFEANAITRLKEIFEEAAKDMILVK